MVSQLAKYDLYTDIDFISYTYFCEELNSKDLAIISIIMTVINLSITIYGFISTLYELNILVKEKKIIKKYNNTQFIN